LVLGVVVATMLAACTDGAPDPDRTGRPASEGAVSAPVSEAAAAASPVPRLSRLALTVGADGPPASLVGVERAQVIVEYPLAADRTGLLALLDAATDVVGPLRSATPSDAALALAFDAHLVTAVTTGGVVEQLADADLSVVEEFTSPGAMVRDPARQAPFNVYAVPSRIRAAVGERPAGRDWPPAGGPPAGGSPPGGRPSDEFTVTAAGGMAVTWTWEPTARRWLRTAAGRLEQSATGERISAGTVVVLEVPRVDRPVVAADLVGAGPALVLREGAVIAGRWERGDAAGAPTIDVIGAASPAAPVWLHICAAPCAASAAGAG
jgi:hypothetical protein